MNAPPTPAPDIRLLSTDFDFTLVGHGEARPFVPELMDLLGVLRTRGVRWAINTGRSPRFLDHGLQEFAFPLRPDFAITSEREVCRPANPPGTGRDNTDWADFGAWNTRCERDHAEMLATARPLLEETLRFIERETSAHALFDPTPSAEGWQQPAGLVASDEPEMDRIAAFLDTLRPHCPMLGYQRNKIYLRFSHTGYDKGTALSELGRLLNLGPEHILAIGDHHNDLSMLDGRYARHVACPANAIDEVKATVRAAGGYVARGTCSEGVVEALQFYCGVV